MAGVPWKGTHASAIARREPEEEAKDEERSTPEANAEPQSRRKGRRRGKLIFLVSLPGSMESIALARVANRIHLICCDVCCLFHQLIVTSGPINNDKFEVACSPSSATAYEERGWVETKPTR